MWESQRLTTLWAFKACYRDSFTLLYFLWKSCHLRSCRFRTPWFHNNIGNTQGPKVAVEWLALLLRIREIPGSNLGPMTRYPEEVYSAFHQPLQINASQLHATEPFLRSKQLLSYIRKSQNFMEPEDSLPCSQEPKCRNSYSNEAFSHILSNSQLINHHPINQCCIIWAIKKVVK
jgi:hypothetical protein